MGSLQAVQAIGSVLFIQAGGFELARSVFNSAIWMREKHGRIDAIAEVSGVWVE